MTICKNCKHKGIFKKQCSNYVPNPNKYGYVIDKLICYIVDVDCCTLNPITGKDDYYDTEFKGNISFNCGGYNALPKMSKRDAKEIQVEL